MDSRNNRIILGIIVLILGVLSLTQNYLNINFDYGIFKCLIIGGSFIILYKFKKLVWALVIGLFFSYYGLASLLGTLFGLQNIQDLMAGSAFFLIPGIIFLILYLQKNKSGLLVPGSCLFWVGVYIIFSSFKSASTICFGLAFLTIYYMSNRTKSIFYAFVGFLFLAVGAAGFLFSDIFVTIFENMPNIGSIALILLAIYLIFGNKKNINKN